MTPFETPSVPAGNFINGQWSQGDGSAIESINPATGKPIWSTNLSGPNQVASAFSAARKAFGSWWDNPVEARIEIARRFAAQVKEKSDELATLISLETGKPLWECKTEVGAVVGKVDVSIDALQTRRSETSFELGTARAVTRFKPHGVVGALGPFNFPAHLPNGHIVPALLAGNAIVFKPSEQTPAVGAWMVKQWEEVGLPAGVLNLVHGGREVGQAMVSNDDLDGLFFTGSSRAGAALNQALAKTPGKILALEMGGNNPLVIDNPSDITAAAYMTILSSYFTAGQRCTCARRLIVIDGDTANEFVEALVKMIPSVRYGLPTNDPEPFMGTVISAETGRRVMLAHQFLIDKGAQSLVEMTASKDCNALLSPGLLDATGVDGISDEEVFGPLATIIRVPDLESAIAVANDTKYGLSAGILTDDESHYKQFLHQIRAGIVNWNRQTTGATGKMPFGGCGESGNNRPSAYFAADYCSWPVASIESTTLALPENLLPGIDL